uniref:Uncharacterized protein n=1 Tax=uncultured bacterium contig00052 TaxID=1181536 RepID=A0A806KHD0_9BACT|nr:hypothetical protein [uncultured bacterium contig00052]
MTDKTLTVFIHTSDYRFFCKFFRERERERESSYKAAFFLYK